MPSVRPVIDRFLSTPWVANTPFDDTPFGALVPQQVQIAFHGSGRMSERELVPITPAARELLFGSSRQGARRVLQGVLATLDGHEGANNLRGLSLSSDLTSFAANLVMSNIEAGFEPDSVAAGDPAAFERSVTKIARAAVGARAQNTGWIDLGPKVSGQLLDVIHHGAAAGRDTTREVALVALHELQHSVTPHDPNTIDERHIWLEEGIAETMTWWPGAADALLTRMGVAPHDGDPIDVTTTAPESLPSVQYRDGHSAVVGLLGLAGVIARREDGSIDATATQRAHQLLQGDIVDRVPRNLARAIVDHQHLDPSLEPMLRDRIVDVAGKPDAVTELSTWVEARGRDSANAS